MSRARFSLLAFVFVALLSWVPSGSAEKLPAASEDAPLGIAVVPFVDSRSGLDAESSRVEGGADDYATWVARELAAQLAAREGIHIIEIEPGSSGAPSAANPEAEDVRGWAAGAGVDSVIVGQLLDAPADSGADAPWRAIVDLRSGHSGASLFRYRVELRDSSTEGSPAQLELLAVSRKIVRDLRGEGDPTPLPRVDAGVLAEEPAETSGSEREDEDEDSFALFKGDSPVRIDADELEVITEGKGRRLIFNKNVKVVQKDVRLETDYLEAFYPEGAREPESMEAQGNVRVTEGDRLIRCLVATYQRDSNSVVCRGEAVLMQGCDEVRGQEIELDLDQDHVRVSGAASVVLWPEDASEEPCGEEG